MGEKLISRTLPRSIILTFIVYIVLPVCIAFFLEPLLLYVLLPLFYLAMTAAVLIVIRKSADHRRYLALENQVLQEKVNILIDQNTRELKNEVALHEKINRYLRLKETIESINQDLGLESAANSLTAIAFTLVCDQKGTCIFYLADTVNNKLSLFKTKKEDRKLIVKAKEGDIFDQWVMRHTSPLFVEDIRKDFRFDLERLKGPDMRSFLSVIAAPIISDHAFLGVIRMDHPAAGFYTQDDLRLLVTICDLGAVALENGELFNKTQDLAIHDGLTGLYTKGYFLERIKEECRRSVRQKKTFSLFMLDIDHFKNYNDEYGHSIGDLVLKNLGHHLEDALRGLGPIISRFGGEEFCVILPRTDKKRACVIADELRLKVEKAKVNLKGSATGCTVSIGVATFPDDTSDGIDLIQKADRALYDAKQSGRNRVVAFPLSDDASRQEGGAAQ